MTSRDALLPVALTALGLVGCGVPQPASERDTQRGDVFEAPSSRAGRLAPSDGTLRFIACGDEGEGMPIIDRPDGEGVALIEELAAGEAIFVMVRLAGDRVEEIRYAGREGPGCERLPPTGDVEARGNEPFWAVDVDGAVARVRSPDEPDGVEYRDGAWSQAAGRWVYEAQREQAGIDEGISLELIPGRCADTMSGARYPFRAVLVRAGSRMEGCALEGRRSQVPRAP